MGWEKMNLDADTILILLRDHFFNRNDKVAVLAPWGNPCPVEPGDALDLLLKTHMLGDAAPEVQVNYSNRRKQGVLKGRFRVGSYTPAADGTTRWLCIDIDGEGHADAVKDPDACAAAILNAFQSQKITAYLEKSGGGQGWHLWCFFNKPVLAKKARQVAFTLIPHDLELASGGFADPRKAKGIEVFPKQDKIRKNGVGNAVWLPWWSGAPEGANHFYKRIEQDDLVEFIPDTFETVEEGILDHVLRDCLEVSTSKNEDSKSTWTSWRTRALAALPLEAI